MTVTTGYPVPPVDRYCAIYNREVRGQSGGFYDPPDIRTTPKRTRRIADEYPEIHAYADEIADAWYGKPFAELHSPARRNRIVAAMMLISDRARREVEGLPDDPKLRGLAAYLILLRQETVERTVGWVVKIANMVAQVLDVIAGQGGKLGEIGEAGSEIVTLVARTVDRLGALALAAEAGELDDPEAAAGIAAEVLDALDDLVDLAPGDLDDEALLEIASRVRQGYDLASALAEALD